MTAWSSQHPPNPHQGVVSRTSSSGNHFRVTVLCCIPPLLPGLAHLGLTEHLMMHSVGKDRAGDEKERWEEAQSEEDETGTEHIKSFCKEQSHFTTGSL